MPAPLRALGVAVALAAAAAGPAHAEPYETFLTVYDPVASSQSRMPCYQEIQVVIDPAAVPPVHVQTYSYCDPY